MSNLVYVFSVPSTFLVFNRDVTNTNPQKVKRLNNPKNVNLIIFLDRASLKHINPAIVLESIEKNMDVNIIQIKLLSKKNLAK